MRLVRITLSGGVLFALLVLAHAPRPAVGQNFGPNNEDPAYCTSVAREAVARFGISATDITDSSIDIVQNLNDIAITTGIFVWFRIKQCPSARLVVQMVNDCRLPRPHTVGDCKIKGIPDY